MPKRPLPAAESLAALGPRRQPRRFWSRAVFFAACVILVNAVFGDKGLIESMRARRSDAAAAQRLMQLRRENAALREEVRRLRSDPRTIETIARGDLRLIRPGEILVTIKDIR